MSSIVPSTDHYFHVLTQYISEYLEKLVLIWKQDRHKNIDPIINKNYGNTIHNQHRHKKFHGNMYFCHNQRFDKIKYLMNRWEGFGMKKEHNRYIMLQNDKKLITAPSTDIYS